MKKQGDFVVYSRNSVLINALVAFSRQVFLPEGPTEHLTLVYLDPAAASAAPTGEQLRNSIKVQADVPPLAEGAVNGWKEVEQDQTAFESAIQWREYAAGLERIFNAPHIAADETRTTPPDDKPSAADLDAAAAEQKAKEATAAAFNGELHDAVIASATA